jgi:chemotaxis protein CheD
MFDDASCTYLLPGEIFFSDAPSMVNTVLGSCISVTMFSHVQKIGMICHSMLPDSTAVYKKDQNEFKYVDHSIEHMHMKFSALQICQKEIEVKLFGGSDMFEYKSKDETVGTKNIYSAINVLQKLGYNIKAKDIGGQFTRKLYFSTETGIVYVRKISRLQGV